MNLISYFPGWIQKFHKARTHPLTEDQVLLDLSIAKFKETYELLNECHRFHELNSKTSFYPSFLGQRVHELIHYYSSSTHFQNLNSQDQRKIRELKKLEGYDLSKALRTTQIASQTLHLFFKDLESEPSETRVLIPRDNPFYQTDLTVFKNSYYGPLPSNGIYESDFKKLTRFYQKSLAPNSTGFDISGSALFQIEFKRAYKKLLTRKEGRALIDLVLGTSWFDYLKTKCTLSSSRVKISQSMGKCLSKHMSKCLKTPFFSLHYERKYEVNLSWLGEVHHLDKIGDTMATFTFPTVILLAHEFIHAAHYRKNRDWEAKDPTELVLYTNAEEKVTITGELNGVNQDPYSENSIREVFGFLPRIYHKVRA